MSTTALLLHRGPLVPLLLLLPTPAAVRGHEENEGAGGRKGGRKRKRAREGKWASGMCDESRGSLLQNGFQKLLLKKCTAMFSLFSKTVHHVIFKRKGKKASPGGVLYK